VALEGDRRAEAKLRLAVEHTKRTLAASTGVAICTVESLKDGLDFSGSIDRLRFDMEVRPIYARVVEKVRELVERAGGDLCEVDEVVFVGGSACLAGFGEELRDVLREDVRTWEGDPTEVLARGCAIQGMLFASVTDTKLLEAFAELTLVKALGKGVGVVFPGMEEVARVLRRQTPLPARRAVKVEAEVRGREERGLGGGGGCSGGESSCYQTR
jgi:heat shock 70kDa protein 1/2/6/8